MNWKVQLFRLNYDEQEVDAVRSVVESGWLTMGERTLEFERSFASFVGQGATAVAVSNGTAALHLALLAVGVGPGDEVVVPAMTFVADINSVMLVGASPVLADCKSLSDWNVCAKDIERKITSRTKAVMVVHYAGVPCDMDDIVGLCERHNLYLIEDCAHAPGATYRGRSVGTFGHVGCWSFFTNKNLSVGEGGMVTTCHPEMDQALRHLRSHGMTSLTLDRHKGRAISYDVVRPGLNYRIDEIRAALGIVQLGKLPAANASREKIATLYVDAFSGIDGLTIPFLGLGERRSAFHIFPVLLPSGMDRNRVIEELRMRGIQSSIHYPSIAQFSAYSGRDIGTAPIADVISARELTLPLYPTMTEDEVDSVIRAFQEVMEVCR